ncbi:ABC transporter substrate-binding protein [Paenibacillus sp. GCM10023252]|uniref:ABC transporter substrate-binding protein n=1 Tax=Paenibacillus sp. GCM10023252 TaxID=3252649 RepID=UPI0036219CD3
MKKLTWLALMLSMVLIVAGCGGGSKNGGNTNEAEDNGAGATDEKKVKIAISQIIEHPSLDATREGFLAALKDGGFEEGKNLEVDFNNAQGEQPNNLSIAEKLATAKNDLVLGIATPSAQAVVNKVKDTPILFAAVTDPLAAKIVDNLDKPSGNVTGASDTNPEAIKQLMDFIAANFPKVKTLGLVINEGETNAVIMADIAEEALEKHGIKLVRAAVTNTSEVQQAAQSLVGRADAYFTTLDNMVVSGVDAILKSAKENKMPYFSSDRETVEKGALATVGFKYYDHGYQVGQMAVEILKNGKKPSELPVTVPDKLDLIINTKTAAEQGIEITEAMKSGMKDPEQNLIK